MEDVLRALNTPLGKTTVYLNVREVGLAACRQYRQVVMRKDERAVNGLSLTLLMK